MTTYFGLVFDIVSISIMNIIHFEHCVHSYNVLVCMYQMNANNATAKPFVTIK